MAAHWRTVAQDRGYDPDTFTDADITEGLHMTISLKNMKGATIGDPENCSAARCLKDRPDVEWTYIGASRGFVVFTDGRKRRFIVNGIPKKQDQTMNIAGETLILRAPSQSEQLHIQHRRLKKRTVARHGKTTGAKSKNLAANKAVSAEPIHHPVRSLAAVMRNSG